MKPAADRIVPTGIITRISAQSRDANRVSVYVEGSFALGLPAADAVELGLDKGVHLDEDLIRRALDRDAVYRARQRGMSLLAHRPRAVAELRDRLLRAGFGADAVTAAVDRLVDLGYLDDESFAMDYARSRRESRGYGPRRIHAELRRRGVADETARRVVSALEAERDPYEDALAAGERAWRRVRSETDARRRRNRLYGYLARRGFGPDVILRVVETLEARPS